MCVYFINIVINIIFTASQNAILSENLLRCINGEQPLPKLVYKCLKINTYVYKLFFKLLTTFKTYK